MFPCRASCPLVMIVCVTLGPCGVSSYRLPARTAGGAVSSGSRPGAGLRAGAGCRRGILVPNRSQHATTTARNILHLGSDEFARMPRTRFVEAELQVRKAAQISYFWARNDRWAPAHQLRDLCALLATGTDASSKSSLPSPPSSSSSSSPPPLPPSVYMFDASVSHAFCTERASCALVAQQCRAVLEARALL